MGFFIDTLLQFGIVSWNFELSSWSLHVLSMHGCILSGQAFSHGFKKITAGLIGPVLPCNDVTTCPACTPPLIWVLK